jgi:hypothetical protein
VPLKGFFGNDWFMRNAHLYALFALLFAGAAFLAVTQTTPQELWESVFATKYAYSLSESGIIFASNDAPIDESLSFISQQESFVLSLVGVQGNNPLNGSVGDALVQQQIVLGGNQKLTMTVIRVYDVPNGKWLGCQTDYGTAKDSQFISIEECQSLLSPVNAFLIVVGFPEPSRSQPLVLLSPKSATLLVPKEEDIPGVNYLFLRTVFPNAEQLIGVANSIVDAVQQPDTNAN